MNKMNRMKLLKKMRKNCFRRMELLKFYDDNSASKRNRLALQFNIYNSHLRG
jgi:hypothetical protein